MIAGRVHTSTPLYSRYISRLRGSFLIHQLGNFSSAWPCVRRVKRVVVTRILTPRSGEYPAKKTIAVSTCVPSSHRRGGNQYDAEEKAWRALADNELTSQSGHALGYCESKKQELKLSDLQIKTAVLRYLLSRKPNEPTPTITDN